MTSERIHGDNGERAGAILILGTGCSVFTRLDSEPRGEGGCRRWGRGVWWPPAFSCPTRPTLGTVAARRCVDKILRAPSPTCRRAAHQVRPGHQSQDRQGARTDHPAVAASARRRGDPVTPHVPRWHGCGAPHRAARCRGAARREGLSHRRARADVDGAERGQPRRLPPRATGTRVRRGAQHEDRVPIG